MRNLARILALILVVLSVATVLASSHKVARAPQAASPYASVLSIAGVEDAYAAKPAIGPGCQRVCTSTGCAWVTNMRSSCYAGTESCIEEACN